MWCSIHPQRRKHGYACRDLDGSLYLLAFLALNSGSVLQIKSSSVAVGGRAATARCEVGLHVAFMNKCIFEAAPIRMLKKRPCKASSHLRRERCIRIAWT